VTRIERLSRVVSVAEGLLVDVGGIDEELREAVRDVRDRAKVLALRERRSGGEEVERWDLR